MGRLKFAPEKTKTLTINIPRSLEKRLLELASSEGQKIEDLLGEAVRAYVDARISPPSYTDRVLEVEEKRVALSEEWELCYGKFLEDEPGFRWLNEVDSFGNPRFAYTCPDCKGTGEKEVRGVLEKTILSASCPKLVEGPDYCRDCGTILVGSHSCRH